MPRARWLVALFSVSLLVFLVWLLPASLVAGRADGLRLGPEQLDLSAVHGRLWRGQAAWRWGRLDGHLVWQVEWRGLTPGVRFALNGAVDGSGWLGGTPNTLALADTELMVPGEVVARLVPRVQFDGTVTARDLSLAISDKRITEAKGRLSYTGGSARLGRHDPVQVQPLTGDIEPTANGATLVVQSSRQEGTLAQATLSDNIGSLKVFRAWASMLGVSRGGDPGDVIFETSLPLWQ